jgi:hypothetical protein
MKTNLDSLFKNDKGLEENGIWFEIKEGVGFKIKRFGGFNSQSIKAALAKHYKPYAKMIEAGSFPPDKEREITLKVFVNACITDWKGIEIDGKAAEFSHDACLGLLMSLPELADALVKYASESQNYREELGNS